MTVHQLIVGSTEEFGSQTADELVLSVRNPAHWQVLRSPYRMRIFEAIRGSGGCCIKELADAFGSSTTALYYHLDLLTRAGMITSTVLEPDGGAATRGGRRPALFAAQGSNIVVEYDPTSGRDRRRMASVTRVWQDESQAELLPAEASPEGEDPLAEATFMCTTAWEVLSESEAEEIRECMDRVQGVLSAARARRLEDASDLKTATHHVAFTVVHARNRVLPSPRMQMRAARHPVGMNGSYQS